MDRVRGHEADLENRDPRGFSDQQHALGLRGQYPPRFQPAPVVHHREVNLEDERLRQLAFGYARDESGERTTYEQLLKAYSEKPWKCPKCGCEMTVTDASAILGHQQ